VTDAYMQGRCSQTTSHIIKYLRDLSPIYTVNSFNLSNTSDNTPKTNKLCWYRHCRIPCSEYHLISMENVLDKHVLYPKTALFHHESSQMVRETQILTENSQSVV